MGRCLRLALAVGLVLLMTTMAGCSVIFGGIDDETLDAEGEYDDLRESDADVAIDVEGGEFRAVYDLNGTEELSLYRSGLYADDPLDIRAVRYWYPNGTELTGSEIDVDQDRSSTDVAVPDGNGTLAFSGDAGAKTFSLPAYVSGSYEVTLPRGQRTNNFFFGDVNPGGYDREIVDDRERLTWDELDSTISVRFFLDRDIYLFAGLVGVVTVLGGGALGVTYLKVKRLRERREEMGLDVDLDDDSDGPPPGMR